MDRDQALPNQASDKWFQDAAARAIHEEQLKRVERFNGRAAMLGIVIGILTEALTGQGVVHQIGLGPPWMAMLPAAPASSPSASDPRKTLSRHPGSRPQLR